MEWAIKTLLCDSEYDQGVRQPHDLLALSTSSSFSIIDEDVLTSRVAPAASLGACGQAEGNVVDLRQSNHMQTWYVQVKQVSAKSAFLSSELAFRDLCGL